VQTWTNEVSECGTLTDLFHCGLLTLDPPPPPHSPHCCRTPTRLLRLTQEEKDGKDGESSSRPVLGRPYEGPPTTLSPRSASAHSSPNLQLLLVGDSGVGPYILQPSFNPADSPLTRATGKSSLLHRYYENEHLPRFISTLGIDFRIKTVEMDGKKIKLQIVRTRSGLWEMDNTDADRASSGIRRGRNASAP
jgi:Ras family